MGVRWKRRAAAADPTPAGNKIRISRNSTRADCFDWPPESANPTNFSYCHCPGWRRVGVGQHYNFLQKIPTGGFCPEAGVQTFANLICLDEKVVLVLLKTGRDHWTEQTTSLNSVVITYKIISLLDVLPDVVRSQYVFLAMVEATKVYLQQNYKFTNLQPVLAFLKATFWVCDKRRHTRAIY